MTTTHRPGYAHGATIPLAHARWIATHIVDRVEGSGGEIVLHSAGSRITLNSEWGIELQTPSEGRSLVRLEHGVRGNIERILAYEDAHPGEPRVGSR